MGKIFKSRGIRLLKNGNTISKQTKIYYEAEMFNFDNPFVRELINNGIIDCFEYSCLDDGEIDAYNYHVNLQTDYSQLYKPLSSYQVEIINSIPRVFDDSFNNYTIGYRFKGQEIIGNSYYFYPTVIRDERYRIKGVTDRETIISEVKNFAQKVSVNKNDFDEIIRYGSIITKLKGVSVHIQNNRVGYKLYARIRLEDLKVFIKKYIKIELDEYFDLYGEIVLVAQRIEDGNVQGYNIYFLK